MSLFVSILGLAFLILVHEAGHFFVARAVGMSPRKFYLGFPPAIAKVRRKGIEYGIGAIPLGGYVKIPGMHRPAPSDVDVHLGRDVERKPELAGPAERLKRQLADGDMDAARAELAAIEDRLRASRGIAELRDGLGADAYWRQRTWKKVAVIFAGPATNLVLAVVLFTVLLMGDAFRVGIRLAASDTGAATTRVEEVIENSPAQAAGLRAGDRVVALDGRPVSGEGLLAGIREAEGAPVVLEVSRRGETISVGPVRPERIGGRNVAQATGRSLEITWIVTKQILAFFPGLVQGKGADQVSSPVGIAEASSNALDQGVEEFLFVLGLISLSLALLNLLPLLPLDGGHIAFSIVEGLRGRSLGREVYERVSMVGIVIVLFLFAIGLSNDIGRISG
jgi:regulator of sigma E protease